MRSITAKELKDIPKIILLSLFTFFATEPIREWIESTFNVNPIIIGVVGIFAVIYFFDIR